MSNLNFPKIVEDTLTSKEIDKLSSADIKSLIGNFTIDGLNAIPCVGGVLAGVVKDSMTYYHCRMIKKYLVFLDNLKGTTQEERQRFVSKLATKTGEFSGDVLSSIIDKFDSIHKTKILANLSKAQINGYITIQEFLRLANVLERIPYCDIAELEKYKEDTYVSGETEILFSAGVVGVSVINGGGQDEYHITDLGIKLLKYGCEYEIDAEAKSGTRDCCLEWNEQ